MKPQVNMKRQAPTSKLLRSSKNQVSKASKVAVYPEAGSGAWELNEAADGNGGERHAFDLEERTARFGEAIVLFCKNIPRGPGNNRLIDQLVGCATSVGANYCEANEAVSERISRTLSGGVSKKPRKQNSSYE